MIAYFQDKFALTKEGSRSFIRGTLWTTLMDLSFILPMILVFQFLEERLNLLTKAGETATKGMVYYLLLGLVFLAVMYLIAYAQYGATYSTVYEESAKQRIRLAETLRKLPLAFFGKKDVADLSATIMDDATQIETLFSHSVPQIYGAVINLILMSILLWLYNWQMSLALLWVVPVSVVVFMTSIQFQKKMHGLLYDKKRDIADRVQENLDCAQEIKAYNQEKNFSDRLDEKLDGYENILIRMELMTGALINFSMAFLRLGLPFMMFFGAGQLAQGQITLLTYLIFLVIATRVYAPVTDSLNNWALLLYLSVRIKRMKEMDTMPRQTGKNEFSPDHFDIVFDKVNFSYEEGQETIRDISFVAKQGDITALVGPSGGGKSTVAKLSARFWDVQAGKITLGGEDISEIDPEILLQSFSIVFQDVTLFNSSVLENIRLGREGASDEEVIKAAESAQCHEFVDRLPQGYDTLIGENGQRLSGGERQRISIARAILKDAPVILLDEATASLDTENESKVQQALGELIKNKTVLIIAHRMRTVAEADKLVVIENGSVAEMGSPQELKEKNGIFAKMLKRQMA